MSGVSISITEAGQMLKAVLERAQPLESYRIATAILRESALKNFSFSGRPRWAPLSDTTRKKRRGGLPLQRTGALRNSITSSYDRSGGSVYTSIKYAPTQQYGARKGEYARNVPWGDVPARPFIVAQDRDITAIENAIARLIDTGER